MLIDIIKCHGSGNRFAMVDAVAQPHVAATDLAALTRALCAAPGMQPCDGLLYVVRDAGLYAMRMFNPDGSEAEMCGNGIRCVARLVRERYIGDDMFALRSGGRTYHITRCEDIFPQMPTFGVDMAIATRSDDFGFMPAGSGSFVAQTIPALDAELRFTALSPGNPHIVTQADTVDLHRLAALGEAVKHLKHDFPRGINVSLYTPCGRQAVFAATYERGAGITFSCGTAMTSCSTAAVLTGLCEAGRDIEVYNRGGMVRCLCRIDGGTITTRLTGNATYEWSGRASWDGTAVTDIACTARMDAETALYDRFAALTAAKYPSATCR